jgi:type I restriction enzyme M protein
MIDRVHRELTGEDIQKIADTYHRWRLDFGQLVKEAEKRSITLDPPQMYEDVAGFCNSANLEDIRAHGHVLTPGRYVGAADLEDDGELLEEKMKRLTTSLEEQFAESAKLEKAIRSNLKVLSTPHA